MRSWNRPAAPSASPSTISRIAKADAVARIARVPGHARLRRLLEQDADESDIDGRGCEPRRRGAARAVSDLTGGAIAPLSLRRLLDGFFAGPVLDAEPAGVRGAPIDLESVDGKTAAEIEDDPLREGRVVLLGEPPRQVRVALPERIRVSVHHARKPVFLGPLVVRETAARERIPQRMADRFARVGVAGEVALPRGVAEAPLRVPVPRLHMELGVQSVRHRAPPGRQDLLERCRRVQSVRSVARDAIDAGAERQVRSEGTEGLARRDGDVDGGGGAARRRRSRERPGATATCDDGARAEERKKECEMARFVGGAAHARAHHRTPRRASATNVLSCAGALPVSLCPLREGRFVAGERYGSLRGVLSLAGLCARRARMPRAVRRRATLDRHTVCSLSRLRPRRTMSHRPSAPIDHKVSLFPS